ncbi:MAG: DUF308 domain-containing protein [Promethearchaeota archaeon]|nr:MAG: DUF308 domain-containing protein [Candidatus Lokiarchaeota archaeon]
MKENLKQKVLTSSNLLFGAFIIIIAIIVMVFTVGAVITLLFILSIAIIIIGLARLVNAYANDELDTSGKIAKFITAIIALIFGVIVIVNTATVPVITVEILIILVNSLLLIIGFVRIFIGLTTKEYFKGFRGFLVLIGVVMIILSLLVFLIPTFDNATSILIISVSMLLSGIARFVLGMIGIKKPA